MEINSDALNDITTTLCKIVEIKTGISKEEFLSKNTKRKYVMARCIYVNLVYIYTGISQSEISKLIDKDRTTVLYMYKLHDNLISVDKAYLKLFQECSQKYISAVCTEKHLLSDPAVIMNRILRVEEEVKDLKNLLESTLLNTSKNEAITS